MFSQEELEKAIIHQNPWLMSEKVPGKFFAGFKRQVFFEFLPKLKNSFITAIIGPRRSGKTNLMFQAIDYLIKQGKNPKNIFFFSFDNPSFLKEEKIIPKVIQTIQTLASKGKLYLFFDEIQYVKDWSSWLKIPYDQKENIKFTVSGSSSFALYKDTSESLVGRIDFLRINNFSFKDFAEYYKADLNLSIDFNIFDLEKTYKALEKNKIKLNLNQNKFIKLLMSYILWGGNPSQFKFKNLNQWQIWLKEEYIGLTLYRDILKLFEVRDTKALEELLYFLASISGQRFSFSKITHNLNIPRQETIKQYLGYLESSTLIHPVYFFSRAINTQLRKEKKIYFNDHALILALLDRQNDILTDSSALGLIVEALLGSHLWNKFGSVFSKNIFYWKNKQGYEVDFVIKKGLKFLPIEVKYKSNINKQDLKGLFLFLAKTKSDQAVVVTKNRFEYSKQDNFKLLYIPLWIFLLLC